jgi:membrane protease YdiL (CAAX protease family)
VGLGLVLAALAVAMAVDHAVAGAHLAVGLGLAACLALIARGQGLTAAELGLARSSRPRGLRWGAAAAALVAAAYALGLLVAPVRQALPGGQGGLGPGTLWAVLVVVGLGGGPANAAIAGAVGGDAAGTAARVAVTVLFTSLAGIVLCWLRLRSGSLLAPALAHWTVNGLGVIVAVVA